MLWQFKPNAPEEFIRQFPEYQPIVLQLLYNRGLRTQQQIDEFFNPDFEGDLLDPFLMLGISQAVKRINKAIKKKEKIAIFGDYDCDGVCGAVILKTILEELGADLSGGVYIPDRIIEGYGLNNEAIEKLGKEKVNLILTVDCGISDVAEVKLANSLGVEVIIVDHHRLGKKLPSAKVIIDPWQPKDKYPFKELAGAGVAFKLAQALRQAQGKALQKNQGKPGLDNKISEGWEKWLLDLVALATVADCVPVLGENRTLVHYGLIVLAQTKRVGLQELMKVARLNPVFEAENLKTNLDTYSLGFILAPRLNAAGRMDHASLAFRLLMTQDYQEAKVLAEKINEQNQQRQKLTDKIVAEVETRIKNYQADKNQPVVVETDKNWSPGVVGLVAGKIADRYHRPVFIFKEDEKVSRGSARSIPTFDIIEAIGQCSQLLKEFGGHPGAAGVSLENKNLSAFKEKINQIAREKLKPEDLIPAAQIDSELEPAEVNWELFDELEHLEPFGRGNDPPVFLLKNLEIANLRVVGNGSKHLKLELKSDKLANKVFHAIGFNLAARLSSPAAQTIGGQAKNGNDNLKTGDKIDIIFELIADEWNGTRNLQLKIIDIKKL
ncbi:single-stranded-DNA-specific exonuclease RecJ [Patescibacteria group bacterium]|nr:single-stranded-DNA-specific exonuclease RecJ [Patescibacteria group bacterium]